MKRKNRFVYENVPRPSRSEFRYRRKREAEIEAQHRMVETDSDSVGPCHPVTEPFVENDKIPADYSANEIRTSSDEPEQQVLQRSSKSSGGGENISNFFQMSFQRAVQYLEDGGESSHHFEDSCSSATSGNKERSESSQASWHRRNDHESLETHPLALGSHVKQEAEETETCEVKRELMDATSGCGLQMTSIQARHCEKENELLPSKEERAVIHYAPNASSSSSSQEEQESTKLVLLKEIRIVLTRLEDISSSSASVIQRDNRARKSEASRVMKRAAWSNIHLTHHGNKQLPRVGNVVPVQALPASAPYLEVLDRNKKKTLQCSLCTFTNPFPSEMKRHLRSHTNERPFRCSICNMAFTMSNNLRRHMKTHSDAQPFKCELCPAAYKDNSALKAHIRRHAGHKPYECEYCPKHFYTNSNLLIHRRLHTKHIFMMYECEHCKKKFPNSSNMRTHIQNVHERKYRFECDICKRKFKQKGSLKRHIGTVHDGKDRKNRSC